MNNPKLAGLALLRHNLDRAYRLFRADPSVSNRIKCDTALSIYQIALASRTAEYHETSRDTHEAIGITSTV